MANNTDIPLGIANDEKSDSEKGGKILEASEKASVAEGDILDMSGAFRQKLVLGLVWYGTVLTVH